MDHIPKRELGAVGDAARVVVRDAKAAGIWIFGCGIVRQQAKVVAPDGMVIDGPIPEIKAVIGGFSIIDVPNKQEAIAWAARIAKACQCNQEVREIMFDPES